MEKESNWKATDSSTVDTKQKNNIGVQNQTTNKSKRKFPLATILVIMVLLAIIGFFLLFLGGPK